MLYNTIYPQLIWIANSNQFIDFCLISIYISLYVTEKKRLITS